MKPRLELTTRGPEVRRAREFAALAGVILVTTNHGDGIPRGEITGGRGAEGISTDLIPCAVSTLSSSADMVETAKTGG